MQCFKMDYRQKKRLTHFTIGLIFLLGGMEYAVILPTIWMYLQILEAPPYFLGLTLSAFSLSGLLTGPLFGLWSDRTLTTKKIILFANLFEIAGNFMYFMNVDKWVLLSSRLVAGIGTGAGSSIFGYLTRTTMPKDRSTIFAAVMACRQIGIVISPAFNIFLRLCNFQLGPFVVNKYTAPGLFMCLLWILHQLAVLLMYWDLPPENADAHFIRDIEDKEEDEEGKPLMGADEHSGSYGTVSESQSEPGGDQPYSFPDSAPAALPSSSNPFRNFSINREFFREEIVVLLTAQFITLFNQTALETMITPLTQKYFNFGELENSVMYFVCGLEVIAGFIFVQWLSRRTADRVVLALGLIVCNISSVWCIIFLPNPLGGFEWTLVEIIIGVFLQLLGLPFVAVAQMSLFSKVTAVKTQGFSQGIRRSVGGLATILGPLWAGGLIFNLYVMLGVMMILLILLTIMIVFSYNRLVDPGVAQHVDRSED